MSDDFYVGYLPRTGARLAVTVRRVAALLLLAFAATAALLVGSMGTFSDAVFEFGVERTFEGSLVEGPAPALVVERPGEVGARPASSTYLLVAFGKFGASAAVEGLGGRRVRLAGSLVYRDDQTMIELVEGSIEDLGPSESALGLGEEDLGMHTLSGEIVDSKCFLGVMKPGNLKPHRACAVRCISGGIPPVLVVRDPQGSASYYILVSAEGESVNADVLDRIAEPVRVRGRVVRRGELTFLYADPETYGFARDASAR